MNEINNNKEVSMEEEKKRQPQGKNFFSSFLANHKETCFFLLGALALVLLDLLSKWAVELNLSVGQMVEVIPNFWYITLSHNTGAAFSAGASWGVWGRVLGIAISLTMSIGIAIYWLMEDKKWNNIYRSIAMLILAGAVGNLIDRAFYWEKITGFNGVIDFMQFYLGGGPSKDHSFLNPFATFNIADACLVIGIIYFLVVEIVQAIKSEKEDPLQKDPRLQEKKKASEQVYATVEAKPDTLEEKEGKHE